MEYISWENRELLSSNQYAVANKQKVYTSDFTLRDKAAVLVGCTAQEIANFVERALKEFGISREQLSVIHFLDTAGSEKMTRSAKQPFAGCPTDGGFVRC